MTDLVHIIINSYFFNNNVRDLIMHIHSELLKTYYEDTGIIENPLSRDSQYQFELQRIITKLKDNYHEFNGYFNAYNLEIGHNLDLLYKKRKFMKLRGYWQEIKYESIYSSEVDFIIYNVFNVNLTNANSSKAKSDVKHFLFFKEQQDTKIKPYTSFIKLLYYFGVNYEFIYKDLFQEIGNEIYDVFKQQICNKAILILIEASGNILFILFYIIISFYLYFSNEIIIKNIIFLFIDFSEKYYEKSRLNNNIISLKLQEFQNLIEDFNLYKLENFSQFLENINKNKSELFKPNRDIKTIFSINIKNNESKNDSDSNFQRKVSSKRISINKMKIEKSSSSKKEIEKLKNKNNVIVNSPKIDNLKLKNKVNDNSYNQVVESFSEFFKNKMNKNIDASKEILKNSTNNSNYFSSQNLMSSKNSLSEKTINRTDSLKNSGKEGIENFQDLLINKSNKEIILKIKVFGVIIFILIFVLILLNLYKFKLFLDFNSSYDKYFEDFNVLTRRISMLFYYTNIFRVLLIFPIDERKKTFENVLENLIKDYEDLNNKYLNILSSNIDKYDEIKKLIDIFKEGSNVSIDNLQKFFCNEISSCTNYLNSEKNIFQNGIDFALKSCITQLSNFYMDYKKLSNKTDINLIKSEIINSPHYKFTIIENSIVNMFNQIRNKIFTTFSNDELNFNQSFYKKMILFNALLLIYVIIIFFFINFYVFISISKYIEPIKDSTYRINCSFFYIKKFSIEKDK